MTTDLTAYLYEMDKTLNNPNKKWLKCAQLLFHSTIDRGQPGIVNREESLSSLIEPTSPHGIQVIPTVRFLRYNTSNCRFLAHGVQARLGFYEADQNNFKHSQLWVQSRTPFMKNTLKIISDYKHCYRLWAMESKSHNFIELKSRRKTTDVYYPSDDSKLFVFKIETIGFLYQEYAMPEFGNYQVWECIQIQDVTQKVICTLKLQNNDKRESIIFRGKKVEIDPFDTSIDLDVFEIPPDTIRVFKTTIDMVKGTMKTEFIEKRSEFEHFPLKLSLDLNNIEHSHLMIHLDGKVQYNNVDYLRATDYDLGDSERTNTKFNEKLNQYLFQ